jgi:hypothetical protein
MNSRTPFCARILCLPRSLDNQNPRALLHQLKAKLVQ